MVKLNALTILNGLLRSQCIQGMYCQKSNIFHKSTGSTFVLDKSLRGVLGNKTLLQALDGIKVGPSHLFIKGASVEDSLEFTIAVLLLTYNFYPKFRTVFTTHEQLELFRLTKEVPKSKVIKIIKYITAELPCMYLNQEEHNKVPPDFFKYYKSVYGYTGRVKTFFSNRLVRKSLKNLKFWNSWLQGIKRACHESETDTIYDNYLDHKQVLSQGPSQPFDPKVMTYVRRVVEEIRVGEVKLYEASSSASFYTPRSKGGQRKDVRDWLIRKFGIGTNDVFVHNNTRYEFQSPNIPDVKTLAKHIVSDYLVDRGIVKPLKVKVHGIVEPLKVRKITKGEAVPYWYCRSIQKDLHGSLQQYEQFAPTGRPIERYDIYKLIEREKTIEAICPLGFNGWVSGDYSAATDGVDIRVTMAILELILDKSPLDENQKDIARAVLGPQEIYYPKVPGKPVIKPFLQKTGQLMGSILSFPILCLINIITYWMSLEQYTGHVYNIGDLPVIVNGDDILFRANNEFYGIWKENIKKVGFNLSIGKNYFHPDVFLINSQMFHIAGNINKDFSLERLPMFNLGLLTGKAKLTGRKSQVVKPLWSWYNETLEGAFDKYDAHKRFLYYHNEQIKNLTNNGQFNLFVQRWQGGLGFKLFDEVKPHIKVTKYQRLLCDFIRRRVRSDCEKGKKPSKYTIRLIQEEQENSSSEIMKPYLSKAQTSITLGFHDRYKLIPVKQPLNFNESLELEEQHNLPLLSNIPLEINKSPLKVLKPVTIGMRQLMKDLYHGDYKPLPISAVLDEREYRLVSVREPKLEELFAQENDDLSSFTYVERNKEDSNSLSYDLKLYDENFNVRTLRKVQEDRLPGGMTLIIHAEE